MGSYCCKEASPGEYSKNEMNLYLIQQRKTEKEATDDDKYPKSGTFDTEKETTDDDKYPKSGMKALALKKANFYRKKIGLVKPDSHIPFGIYERLGQFTYDGDDETEDLYEVIGVENKRKWIYVGQIRPGTEVPEGIGIAVSENGHILEGYFKDGKMNGNGRIIYPNGEYYIGEFKDCKPYGKGETYLPNGNIKELIKTCYIDTTKKSKDKSKSKSKEVVKSKKK